MDDAYFLYAHRRRPRRRDRAIDAMGRCDGAMGGVRAIAREGRAHDRHTGLTTTTTTCSYDPLAQTVEFTGLKSVKSMAGGAQSQGFRQAVTPRAASKVRARSIASGACDANAFATTCARDANSRGD